MTTAASLVLVVAAGFAALDWLSLATNNPRLERLAKPAVMVALILAAVLSDLSGWGLAWLLVGLTMGLVGDILLLPSIDRFVPGLAAFLIGHLGYAALAIWLGVTTSNMVVGLVLMSVGVMTVGSKITDSVQGTAMFAPVVAYVVTIGLSTALLVGTGRLQLAVGAVLFALSDSLLGWGRFISPAPGGRLAVHVTYHLAQLLIVIGIVAGR